ncbi:hypothetical protein [Xenorhabdus szentirmaii]
MSEMLWHWQKRKGVAMRFSFGRPTFDYKDRWCHREKLYKVITF